MTITFNAQEVLSMAIRAEEGGAAFYRKAAEQKKDALEVAFLEKMAAMEDEHAKTFQAMLDGLTDEEKASTTYDPMGEAELYLEAMVDAEKIEGTPQITMDLTGDEDIKDILKKAVQLERDAILFYMGLADLVPERLGLDKVESIIKEERSHVVILAKELKKLQ